MQENSLITTIVRNGSVIDPANGLDGEVRDIAIDADGTVVAVAPDIAASAEHEIDATGAIVTPGLVEIHTHIYEGACKVGVNVTEGHYQRGVVAAADGGTAGSSTFKGFRKFIVDPAPLRVLSFLNVSVLGLVDQRYGELMRPEALHPEDIRAVYADNSDVIKGLKIRLSHDIVPPREMIDALRTSVQIAQELGIPLMAHVGHTEQNLAEIVAELQAGDIVTHCYTGKGNGILTDGRVDDTVLEARARGVLFDVGHGTTQMSYGIARTAIAQGFPPHLIGSDLSLNNWKTPAFDLATVMSKMIALGMPRIEAVRATTATPASVLGITDEGYGSITPGRQAFLTLFDVQETPVHLPDAAGDILEVDRWEPTMSVLGTVHNVTTPWRGRQSVPA
jgi:dihydroorotase